MNEAEEMRLARVHGFTGREPRVPAGSKGVYLWFYRKAREQYEEERAFDQAERKVMGSSSSYDHLEGKWSVRKGELPQYLGPEAPDIGREDDDAPG